LGQADVINFPSEAFRYAGSISWIAFLSARFDVLNVVGHGSSCWQHVADKALTLVGLHKAKEFSRLGVVIIIQSVIVAVY